MDSDKRFVTGLDVGTENIRAVIASIDKEGKIAIVGFNEGKSAGMRKGIPANLAGPAGAIDRTLGDAERMGGYDVRSAYVSINGSTVMSNHTEGMIAVGTIEHEIDNEDLMRVEDIAVSGRIPANREVLDVIPLEYALDGQSGIKILSPCLALGLKFALVWFLLSPPMLKTSKNPPLLLTCKLLN